MPDPLATSSPPVGLAGQAVLVTGAADGIGGATARAFAAAGARVALHYHRREAEARQTLASLLGNGHILLRADLMDEAETASLVAQAHDAFGRLDVLVNNAGLYLSRPLVDHDLDSWRSDFRRLLRVNLEAAADLCFLAARIMRERHYGRIVNVSSRGAYRGEPEAPGYGASKAGLNALTQSLALALAPHGIGVYGVAPGWVETRMAHDYLQEPRGEAIRAQSPLRRVARPEEIARTILFLADPASEYLTGAIVDVNGASYLR